MPVATLSCQHVMTIRFCMCTACSRPYLKLPSKASQSSLMLSADVAGKRRLLRYSIEQQQLASSPRHLPITAAASDGLELYRAHPTFLDTQTCGRAGFAIRKRTADAADNTDELLCAHCLMEGCNMRNARLSFCILQPRRQSLV